VDYSLHASQPHNSAAAKKANAILQCITSSEECNTQEADPWLCMAPQRAQLPHCVWLWAALLNCREPRIAQQERGSFKTNHNPDP